MSKSLSNTKMRDIEFYCCSYVGTMFSMMLNPKFRGENFTWENFPNMVANLCEVGVHLEISSSPMQKDAVGEYARKMAINYAEKYVKNMMEK